ncbi:hypothetical protein PTKIN_Ptkin13bG0206300 [Pterospermum kingtungense]
MSADVRDYDAVKRAVLEAGRIDVLVVNLGVFVNQELEKQGLDAVKLMIDVNLMGTFNVIKAALPLMKARKDPQPASIALMSSQVGQASVATQLNYSSTKFGLRGLAELLQQEVISGNIHLSLIFPFYTDTPGREEDIKVRPELTSIITGSSVSDARVLKADEVAQKTFDGVKCGTFSIPLNLEERLLALATAGLSPQRCFLMAFLEFSSTCGAGMGTSESGMQHKLRKKGPRVNSFFVASYGSPSLLLGTLLYSLRSHR